MWYGPIMMFANMFGGKLKSQKPTIKHTAMVLTIRGLSSISLLVSGSPSRASVRGSNLYSHVIAFMSFAPFQSPNLQYRRPVTRKQLMMCMTRKGSRKALGMHICIWF